MQITERRNVLEKEILKKGDRISFFNDSHLREFIYYFSETLPSTPPNPILQSLTEYQEDPEAPRNHDFILGAIRGHFLASLTERKDTYLSNDSIKYFIATAFHRLQERERKKVDIVELFENKNGEELLYEVLSSSDPENDLLEDKLKDMKKYERLGALTVISLREVDKNLQHK